LETTTFAAIPHLYDTLVKAKQNRLDDHCKVDGVESSGNVFRCYEATEHDKLHCKRQLPVTTAEPPDITEKWREVDAQECIERGQSVLILGRPGTGKSTLTCELVKLLRGEW
jgi:ABC-type transport system involved in cytochrome bd biosynthesis fused ATPase/permease subunit